MKDTGILVLLIVPQQELEMILKLMMNIFNSINLNFLNLDELEIHLYKH